MRSTKGRPEKASKQLVELGEIEEGVEDCIHLGLQFQMPISDLVRSVIPTENGSRNRSLNLNVKEQNSLNRILGTRGKCRGFALSSSFERLIWKSTNSQWRIPTACLRFLHGYHFVVIEHPYEKQNFSFSIRLGST
jgi:hypothetical protein